jgi:murein DD-endopeptidase MepM/ murein hydrolase activator NlpD
MNIKKRFSVLFIPHHPGKIMEKKISVNLLVIIMVGLFVVISAGAFFFLGAGSRAYDRVRLYQLEKENSYLHAKLNEFNAAAEDLKAQMADLIEKEKKVRMVFGLPQVDEQIRRLGVGGPSPYSPTDLDTELGQVRASEMEVDRLLRQARFEKDNFDQIFSLLSEKKEILNHTPSIRPSAGYLSCGYGMRTDPFTGRRELHRGVDLAADIGTPVYVTADGVISQVSRDVGLGKLVKVDHRHGYSTIYAHLSRISVKRGQQVKRGELIGAVGNTGYSTGPHLHYEVYLDGRAQNPFKYFLGDHLASD